MKKVVMSVNIQPKYVDVIDKLYALRIVNGKKVTKSELVERAIQLLEQEETK